MTGGHGRRRWRLHARTRLTLWYTVLMASSLLLLGWLAQVVVEHALYANLDDALRTRARTFEEAVLHELEEGEHTEDLVARELAGQAIGVDVLRAWDQRGRRLIAWEEGAPIRTTGSRPPAAPTAATFTTERLASGMAVRLLTQPLRSRGRPIGVVQIGRSIGEIDAVLARLRLFGVGGTALALALAGAGGTFLARRALAPIERITGEAQAIGSDDLSRRLGLDLPDDEVGRLARAFDAMIARLETAFERQRRFTADASHELRTPLSIVRTEIDVALSQAREPAEYVRVLRQVRVEIERLSHLTEQLLTLARADGPGALTLVPVDLQEIVGEVGVSVTRQAHARGIHLEVTLDDAPEVRGDPIWLRHLLLNLVENALRHTPDGGRVALTLKRGPDGVTVNVRDTGEGIAPEHLPHLFERFYRVDDARGRTDGGAGLGLAIGAWVARAHGGRLTAASTVGEGTTMTLWLPEHPPAN